LLELGAEERADGMVRYWVRDNGPGLSEEKQAVLFTEFIRLNELRIQGYGLGLSIVRRIIDKLDGRVGVNSRPDEGSQFYFELRKPEL
jgi:signal transduction histidine kinase